MKTMLGKGFCGVFFNTTEEQLFLHEQIKIRGLLLSLYAESLWTFGVYFFMTSFLHASTIIIGVSVSSVTQYNCKTPRVGFLLCLILLFLVFYSYWLHCSIPALTFLKRDFSLMEKSINLTLIVDTG